jgi:hypothetical protein
LYFAVEQVLYLYIYVYKSVSKSFKIFKNDQELYMRAEFDYGLHHFCGHGNGQSQSANFTEPVIMMCI